MAEEMGPSARAGLPLASSPLVQLRKLAFIMSTTKHPLIFFSRQDLLRLERGRGCRQAQVPQQAGLIQGGPAGQQQGVHWAMPHSFKQLTSSEQLRAIARKNPQLAANIIQYQQQLMASQMAAGHGLARPPAGQPPARSGSLGSNARPRKEPSAAKSSKKQRVGGTPSKAVAQTSAAAVQPEVSAPTPPAVPANPLKRKPSDALSQEGSEGGAGSQGPAAKKRGKPADGAPADLPASMPGNGSAQRSVSPRPGAGSGKSSLAGCPETPVAFSPSSPDASVGMAELGSRGPASSQEAGHRSTSVPRASTSSQNLARAEQPGTTTTFMRALSPGGHEPVALADAEALGSRWCTPLSSRPASEGSPDAPWRPLPAVSPQPAAEAPPASLPARATGDGDDGPAAPSIASGDTTGREEGLEPVTAGTGSKPGETAEPAENLSLRKHGGEDLGSEVYARGSALAAGSKPATSGGSGNDGPEVDAAANANEEEQGGGEAPPGLEPSKEEFPPRVAAAAGGVSADSGPPALDEVVIEEEGASAQEPAPLRKLGLPPLDAGSVEGNPNANIGQSGPSKSVASLSGSYTEASLPVFEEHQVPAEQLTSAPDPDAWQAGRVVSGSDTELPLAAPAGETCDGTAPPAAPELRPAEVDVQSAVVPANQDSHPADVAEDSEPVTEPSDVGRDPEPVPQLSAVARGSDPVLQPSGVAPGSQPSLEPSAGAPGAEPLPQAGHAAEVSSAPQASIRAGASPSGVSDVQMPRTSTPEPPAEPADDACVPAAESPRSSPRIPMHFTTAAEPPREPGGGAADGFAAAASAEQTVAGREQDGTAPGALSPEAPPLPVLEQALAQVQATGRVGGEDLTLVAPLSGLEQAVANVPATGRVGGEDLTLVAPLTSAGNPVPTAAEATLQISADSLSHNPAGGALISPTDPTLQKRVDIMLTTAPDAAFESLADAASEEVPADAILEAPAAATTDVPADATLDVPADATSDAPADARLDVPANATLDVSADATLQTPADDTLHTPADANIEPRAHADSDLPDTAARGPTAGQERLPSGAAFPHAGRGDPITGTQAAGGVAPFHDRDSELEQAAFGEEEGLAAAEREDAAHMGGPQADGSGSHCGELRP
jgi:hypothetical protein